MNLGCSVLIQLFPVDPAGGFVERGLHRSVLGRVVSKGLERRALHKSAATSLSELSIQTVGGTGPTTFQPNLAAGGTVSLPATVPSGGAFSNTGNILGDFDSMLVESVWPATSAPSNSYSSWV